MAGAGRFSKPYYDTVHAQADFIPLPLNFSSSYYPSGHMYQYKEGYMAQKEVPGHLDRLDGRQDGLYVYPTPLYKVHVYIVDHGLDVNHPGKPRYFLHAHTCTLVCARRSWGSFNACLSLIDISGKASMPYNPHKVSNKSMEHGTQAASLVAGAMAGVTKTASLIGIAVCNGPTKHATDQDFREALDWVLNHLDRGVSNVIVVSMATDFFADVFSENMYKRFMERDVLFVFPPLSNRNPSVLTMHTKMQVAGSICVGGLTEDLNFFGGTSPNNTDIAMVADRFLVAACRVNDHYFGYQMSSDASLATAVVGGMAAVFLSRRKYTGAAEASHIGAGKSEHACVTHDSDSHLLLS